MQCESRTGTVSPVGRYDLSTLSEDSDSGAEQGQALELEQIDGPGGEGECAQEETVVSRASLTSSILKQVIQNSLSSPIRNLVHVICMLHAYFR